MVNTVWALVEDEVVKELTTVNPHERYPDNFIWVPSDESTKVGYEFKGGSFFPAPPTTLNPDKTLTENQRLIAYADPINGSDRYFCEVMSLQAEGFSATSTEVKDAKSKGLARKQEIKLLYPYLEV